MLACRNNFTRVIAKKRFNSYYIRRCDYSNFIGNYSPDISYANDFAYCNANSYGNTSFVHYYSSKSPFSSGKCSKGTRLLNFLNFENDRNSADHSNSVINSVGDCVGDCVGNSVGKSVGKSVGNSVGDSVGNSVGNCVGNSVDNSVGSRVDSNTIIVRQLLGGGRHRDYEFPTKATSSPEKSKRKPQLVEGSEPLQKRIQNIISEVKFYCLPSGYPYTVGKGYKNFVQGQMVSTMLTTTSGVLATQSMLYAVGLGSGAIPLAATLNWILKDGLGQLGGVIFASQVSNKFDSDPKRWRMIAELVQETASLIELCTPLAPKYFLPLAAIANVGHNVSYLAASASRAAIHKSFAINNNLADLTAKTGLHYNIASLFGTGFGISLATIAAMTDNQYLYTFGFFASCSSLSMFASYYSLQAVTISILSLERLQYLLEDYCFIVNRTGNSNSHELHSVSGTTNTNGNNQRYDHKQIVQMVNRSLSESFTNKYYNNRDLLTPTEMLSKEEFLGVPTTYLDNHSKLIIGGSFNAVFKNQKHFQDTMKIFKNNHYAITINKDSKKFYPFSRWLSNAVGSGNSNFNVNLLFKEKATTRDVLDGIFAAHVVRKVLDDLKIKSIDSSEDIVLMETVIRSLDSNLIVSDQAVDINDFKSIKNEFIDKLLSSNEWSVSIHNLEPIYARIACQ